MYCTIEDIESLLNSQYFEKHRKPNRTTLTAIANQIASQIDGILGMYGYDIPPTDSAILSLVSSMNANGVAATLMAKDHPADSRPDNVFKQMFDAGVKVLISRHYVPYKDLSVEEDRREW